jgi:hypothetical protein
MWDADPLSWSQILVDLKYLAFYFTLAWALSKWAP